MKSIQAKLLLFSVVIVSFSAILGFSAFFTFNKISKINQTRSELNKINYQLDLFELFLQKFITSEHTSSQFYTTKNSIYLDSATVLFNQIKSTFDLYAQNGTIEQYGYERELIIIEKKLEQHIALFKKYVELQYEQGFKDFGLSGAFRNAIHELESSELPYDKVLMLTLRRHEKDFMLRKEISYVGKFEEVFYEFQQSLLLLEEQGLTNEEVIKISKMAEAYRQGFLNLVEINKQMGLNGYTGLIKDINDNLLSVRVIWQPVLSGIDMQATSLFSDTLFNFSLIFATQIVLGVLFGIIFGRRLSKRINRSREYVSQLASGQSTQLYVDTDGDELTETINAINHLSRRITVASEFAQTIGQSKLDTEYNAEFINGDLERSLILMRNSLVEVRKREDENAFVNQKITQINDLIRNADNEVESIVNATIKSLVDFSNANQAGIYVIDKDIETEEKILNLSACYAYGRKRSSQKTIGLGHGLVGQCALEMRESIITHVPQSYFEITSGLGAATPNIIILLPLMATNQLVGVLELAFFALPPEYVIEFLRKSAESLAASIRNVRISQGRADYMVLQRKNITPVLEGFKVQ